MQAFLVLVVLCLLGVCTAVPSRLLALAGDFTGRPDILGFIDPISGKLTHVADLTAFGISSEQFAVDWKNMVFYTSTAMADRKTMLAYKVSLKGKVLINLTTIGYQLCAWQFDQSTGSIYAASFDLDSHTFTFGSFSFQTNEFKQIGTLGDQNGFAIPVSAYDEAAKMFYLQTGPIQTMGEGYLNAINVANGVRSSRLFPSSSCFVLDPSSGGTVFYSTSFVWVNGTVPRIQALLVDISGKANKITVLAEFDKSYAARGACTYDATTHTFYAEVSQSSAVYMLSINVATGRMKQIRLKNLIYALAVPTD